MPPETPHAVHALPETRLYGSTPFPLCLTPATGAPGATLRENRKALVPWARAHATELERLLREHGAVLLRGFGKATATPESFAAFVADGLQLPNFPYALGNAVRTAVVGDRVFTANESPPDKPIPWHHELAQTPAYPERLLFYCDREPSVGGETPILLSTAVYTEIARKHPAFIAKLERAGVVYQRVMSRHDRPHSAIGRGWAATFGAHTRKDVERVLKQRDYRWTWLGDGEDALLRETSPVLDAVKPVDGASDSERRAFFNQIVAVWGGWRDELNEPRNCVKAGDGSEFDPDVMASVTAILDSHRVAIPWQRGDILYIDNMQVQHSRSPFEGKRRVLASLANAPTVSD